MKELYCEEPGKLIFREVSKSAPKDNEVRIRSIYGGICGSDINVYKGKITYARYPIIAGHEVLGRIVDAGAGAAEMKGKRVVVFPNTFCEECDYCKHGLTNVCECKIPIGLSADGVFSEEFNIDKKYAVEVPDEVPDERAVLIEPLSVTLHAIKRAKIGKGDKVAVFGCGTEGLLSAAVAAYLGAEVTSLDIKEEKFAAAKALGAKYAMKPEAVDGKLFDAVIEASGARPAAEQAYQIVRPGGRVLHIGIIGEITVPLLKVVRSELEIYGSIIYTLDDFATAIKYLSDPAFVIDPVRSKIVPFSDALSAFEDAVSGEFAKIVLDFSK